VSTAAVIFCLVLLLGAIGPAAGMAAIGRGTNRLVGLELASASAVLFMVVFTLVSGESYELIVPLVLAPLMPAGTLVFTRTMTDVES
jgi:multisubunit Na+/H+ antiporter MnhF subunit